MLQFGFYLLELHNASQILIWNWKQDSLIFDSSSESLLHHIGDFGFLSCSIFLVMSTSLHLYVLNPPSSVTLVATLHLPPILPLYRALTEITVHSGALHSCLPTGVLFTPALSECIQVISVKYGRFLKYTMFMQTSTLLHYVEHYVNRGSSPNLVMHWDI